MDITTSQIRKVRRSAIRAKQWSPCVSCKAYGSRCNQSRTAATLCTAATLPKPATAAKCCCRAQHGARCTRCSKLGRPCVKLNENDYIANQQTSSLVAERPLKFRAGLNIDHESLPSIQLHPNLLWASIELIKNTAVGHDVDSLTDFFQSLTLYQSSVLLTAMNHAVSFVNSIDQPFPPTPPETSYDEVQSFTATGGRNSNQYWDMDTVTASLRTTFDPATRRRRAIIANARQAALYGMHPEEFQARAARHTIAKLLRINPPHQRILHPHTHPSGTCMHRMRVTRRSAPPISPHCLPCAWTFNPGAAARALKSRQLSPAPGPRSRPPPPPAARLRRPPPPPRQARQRHAR